MSAFAAATVRSNAKRTSRFAIRGRQTWAIAETSFGTIAKSPVGLALVAVMMLVALLMPVLLSIGGVSLLPRTANVLTVLTAPVANNPRLPWVLIPLLIVFYAGELLWRERDAGLSEIADATPVPDWVFFLGKFLGLTLALLAWLALLTSAGVLGQMRMGYFDFEIGLYLRVLFGLQLIDYLLFAMLVFVIHAVVNQKHLGYLVALIAYGVILFPSRLGIEHHLLIYSSSPGWSYSDIRGFGASFQPWLWFKLYWAAWALLLAVAATLLSTRGVDRSLWSRLRVARRRFTRASAAVAATAVALIPTLGGFIFYNTNVLNRYRNSSQEAERRAEYEKRYGKFASVAQPSLTATNLRIEIYPEQRQVEIRGAYVLANTSSTAIDSIHVTTVPEIETRAIAVDRPASPVLADDDLGYRVYALEKPLQPGDSLHLNFELHVTPHGFRNRGADAAIVQNGSSFTNRDWLPAIGYQRNRELDATAVRRQYGLSHRPAVPSLDDPHARGTRVGGDPIAFEAVIGTSANQVAVAPGILRRSWTEGGRRYFHYLSEVPVNNEYAVFSAGYAVHEEQWTPSTDSGQAVAIQIVHHPGHTANQSRMVAAVRAALDYYTSQYGPYPYRYLRLIENPVLGMGVRTEAATIEYGQGFSLLNPGAGPQNMDVVLAVVAHAVARGWWGMQVAPADVEGAGLLDVSLETYSGMQVLEDTLGPEHLRRYLNVLREEYTQSRTRSAPPLLKATGSFAYARKGPLALYTLREYIGRDRIDAALKRLFEKHRSGAPPLPTSLDLYQELQAATPDEFQSLLRDLFEKNTSWDLTTERVTARQTSAEAWQVTLHVRARKLVVDEAGIETEVPMNDWVEVGVFGEGEPIIERRRIHSGQQTITMTAPHKPTRAGIDPRNLLIDLNEENNSKDVKIGN